MRRGGGRGEDKPDVDAGMAPPKTARNRTRAAPAPACGRRARARARLPGRRGGDAARWGEEGAPVGPRRAARRGRGAQPAGAEACPIARAEFSGIPAAGPERTRNRGADRAARAAGGRRARACLPPCFRGARGGAADCMHGNESRIRRVRTGIPRMPAGDSTRANADRSARIVIYLLPPDRAGLE